MSNEEFINYVYSFYGKNGIYFIAGLSSKLTLNDIELATKELQAVPNREFCADSFDREMVRDILMNKFNVV